MRESIRRYLKHLYLPLPVLAALLAACDASTPQSPPALSPMTDFGDPPGEMVLIPAGEFVMGSNRQDTENRAREYGQRQPWYVDEHPERVLSLAAFRIDRFEVTNAQFARFFVATGKTSPASLRARMAQEPANWGRLPAVHVSWYMAGEFCHWAGRRLPTEAEWEKAARGPAGLEYPWGPDWEEGRANAGREDYAKGVAPVGSYPRGVSAWGIHDLAGNVSEWVQDWYQAYPGGDFHSEAYGERHRVVRGGGWGGVGHYAMPHFYRGATRDYEQPGRGFDDIGFRCATSGPGLDPVSGN